MSVPPFRVIFSPNALEQLVDLESTIISAGAPQTAAKYVDAIVAFCQALADFPERGVSRADLAPDLHTTHYRGRTVIAYRVRDAEVAILGVYYGGQDYESRLDADLDD